MNRKKARIEYPYILDHKPGFFLNWFLYRLFKRVSFDRHMRETLRQLHREGTIVYAVKYRGQLDYLLYHFNFRRKRVPYPKLAFDLNMSLVLPLSRLIKVLFSLFSSLVRTGRLPNPYKSGFYKKAIKGGTTSLVFLVDPVGFSRHFVHQEKDHLSILLETQAEMERPIFIVPQLILYKKTPEKDHPGLSSILFGFKDKPGVIRKIMLFFRHNRRAFIDFGEPINLKKYMEHHSSVKTPNVMSLDLKQLLVENIDRQKRVILGPIMKSRQQLKEIVLMDEGLRGKIERMAGGNEKEKIRLRKKAGDYFDEIAADYNISYIQFFHRALRWFWGRIFDGVDYDPADLNRVRELAREGSLIYVPSHKSHIDYLVLNYVLHDFNMHIPRIAAGKNLTFWPMGHIFRKSGAFFIRRTFKGAKLYAEVFNQYIKILLQEGHPIEFFIEGGRSRSGKLILPKFGFLSILLQAFREGAREDLIFIPASISYDRILEEKSYLRELSGGKKEKENFKQIIKARQFLKMNFGKVYIRFGAPLSLKAHLSGTRDINHTTPRQFGFNVVQEINRVTLATPLAIVATAILTKHRRGFYLSDLLDTADIITDTLKNAQAPLADTLNDSEKAFRETVALLRSWKVISLLEDIEWEESYYFVDDDQKRELEYYKNSIIHYFLPQAFISISLSSGREDIKKKADIVSDCRFLINTFKKEFVFDEKTYLSQKFDDILADFIEAAYILEKRDPAGYQLTRAGFDKTAMWATLIKTFLESYWIAITAFRQFDGKDAEKGDPIKGMHALGMRLHKMGRIDHIEAVSQVTFKNATAFIKEELLGSGNRMEENENQKLRQLTQFGERLSDLLQFGL